MIFVDTGAWIAVTDASDQYHYQAVKIYALLKRQRKRLITTDYVIDETVTRLRYDAGHSSALRYLDLLTLAQEKGTLRIVYNTEAIFQKAITVFRRYDTIDVSLTDCVSFVVCQQLKIPYAFSFDKHFPIHYCCYSPLFFILLPFTIDRLPLTAYLSLFASYRLLLTAHFIIGRGCAVCGGR